MNLTEDDFKHSHTNIVLIECSDDKIPRQETLGVRSENNVCITNLLENAFSPALEKT